MSTDHKATIGFIGLGAMGMGMATSLIKAEFTVNGYDINPNAVENFVEAGGRQAASGAAAAQDAEILILVVVNSNQVENILFGPGAAVDALPAGSLVMLCSTVTPAFAIETARRLESLGYRMLDAPISGGAAKAASGSLSIMASGRPEAFAQAEGVLAAMAENVYRLGDNCGQGSTVKMVNQLLAGVHIAAAAEAIAFGVRAGIDGQTLYDVISNSAGASWMFQNRVPHMLSGDYTPLSAVDIFVKDLGIVLETGEAQHFPLPLSAAAHQMFLMASAAGFGKLDDSAVVRVFEQLAGIDVSHSGSTG